MRAVAGEHTVPEPERATTKPVGGRHEKTPHGVAVDHGSGRPAHPAEEEGGDAAEVPVGVVPGDPPPEVAVEGDDVEGRLEGVVGLAHDLASASGR